MTRPDRAAPDGDRSSQGRLRLFAAVSLIALVAMSGVLAPVGPVDVSFPVIGSSEDSVTGGGADDPTASVSAEGTDSDRDGLVDEVERDLGTDPNARDTDGDGYPDGMEVACDGLLPDADPLRQDVYVEVDSVGDASLSEATIDRLETSFADGPVSNPGDEAGIALHFVRSDETLTEDGPVNNRDSGSHIAIDDYRSEHFDHADIGYHYLLVVSDAAYNGDPSYAGAGYRGNVVVEHYERPGVMASLIMHELGHSFGLMHNQDGVDEEAYALEEYQSVMNYNGIYETMTYSDGDDDLGRDEWSFVAEDRHTPTLDCPDGDCTALCTTDG